MRQRWSPDSGRTRSRPSARERSARRLLRDNDAASMASSIEQRVPLVDHVLFESVDRLPDQARYQPLGRKAMLRRIGLRGLDPALFDRPKSGFVLPFNRWIRRGLKDAMDQTFRDPQAIAPVGLNPAAVERLWRAFLNGAPGMYWSRSLVALRFDPMVPSQPRVPLRLLARAGQPPSFPVSRIGRWWTDRGA